MQIPKILGSLRINNFFQDDDFQCRHELGRRRQHLRAKSSLRCEDGDLATSRQIQKLLTFFAEV